MENVIKINFGLRDEVRDSLLESLRSRGVACQPWLDLVEQYMNLWDTSWLLNQDIQSRGVIDMSGNYPKKNDSVGQLVNINKQMNQQLEKLGIEAPVKKSGGANV